MSCSSSISLSLRPHRPHELSPVDKSTIERSVRLGEKVLRKMAQTAAIPIVPTISSTDDGGSTIPMKSTPILNSTPGITNQTNQEIKMSEDDSGISGVGPERSGSGSGSGSEEDDQQSSNSKHSEDVPADGVWEIERILDYDKGTDLYKVKWKDWHEDFNTWEPENNLLNCEAEMLRFYLQRKEERKRNEAQNKVVTLRNRKRRRPGPVLKDVPPDPRPLQTRAQEFYKLTQVPSVEEIAQCEILWKRFAASAKKNPWVWPMKQLNKVLEDGLDGKLNSDERKTLREQLLVQQFDTRRQTVTKQLKEWERDINSTTNGMPVVSVENEVDLAGPPPGFKYTNDYVPGPGIKIPDEPPLGCSCTNCIQTKMDCCAHQSNSQFAYSQHKRLRVPIGTPIYECNKTCKCGSECSNRVVQDGRTCLSDRHYTIYRTSNGCGWGVKTRRFIKRGTFVSLYVGEVITTDESDRRAKEYDAEGCTYLFDLDFNDEEAFPYAVDAAKYGNLTHFINHSCDPNLAVFAVWVDCLDPNLPKLALFSIKDICRGEQLTFDYMNRITNTPGSPRASDETKQMKPCLCESENCRKYLFT